MPIVVDADFGYTMIVIAATAIQCLVIGMAVAGSSRNRIFNKDFMETHFGDMHRAAFGEEIKKEGYPDMGSGFYSQRLSYKNWVDFNNRQRAHYNFIEQIVVIIPLLFLTGIAQPIAASVIGWIIFVGRILYTIGYVSSGSKGRLYGALVMDIAILVLFVYTGVSCYDVIHSGK